MQLDVPQMQPDDPAHPPHLVLVERVAEGSPPAVHPGRRDVRPAWSAKTGFKVLA
jgi:hypothetical protein